MTPEQQKAIALARARRRRQEAEASAKPERGFGQALYDNIIGDPNDGVTSYGESLGTWLNRAGDSMTLGVVGDEASAAATGLLPGRSYDGELERYRQNEEGMSTTGRLSADIFGGLVPGAAGVGVVTAAPTVGAAMRTGAILGGGAGAVQGFMEGEGGAGQRLLSGGGGALVGTALGGAVPLAAHGAGKVFRAGKEALGNRRMAASLGQSLGVKPETARALSETVGLDDASAIQRYLDDAGGHGMLADASPAASGALDAAMQAPGRASRLAHDRITGRASQSAQDLGTALDNTLGPVKGAVSLSDDIRLGSAPARQAAYDAAYSAPINYADDTGRQIEQLLKRVPADAVRKANSLMALEGNQSRQIMAQIAEDGSVTYSRMPDVRQLDYLTRALNDVAAAADGQGKLGGTTALGQATANLSRDIRGATKTAVPEYGKALDVASDAISERNALDLGFRLLNRNTTREEVTDAVRGASQAELSALRRGVRSNLDETLANVRAVISDHNIEPRQAMEALRQLTSPASQQKMQAILGDGWGALKGEIDKAARALQLRSQVATNSRTMGRTAANEALNDAIEPGLLRQGKPVAAARDAVSTAMGASKTAVNRLRGDAKAEMADLLTRQGEGGAILKQIEQARQRYAVPPNAGQKVGILANILGLSAVPRAAEAGGQGIMSLLLGR